MYVYLWQFFSCKYLTYAIGYESFLILISILNEFRTSIIKNFTYKVMAKKGWSRIRAVAMSAIDGLTSGMEVIYI